MAKTKRSKLKSSQRNQNRWRNNRLIAQALVLLGFIFMLTSGLHWYLRLQALSFDQQVVETYQEEIQPDTSLVPVHIKINWFVNVEIDPHVITDGNWTISSDKASYLMQSARPGEAGNIILYGHNTREILGNIRALKGGEIITIKTEDGSEFQYQVEELHQVSPTDLSLLLQTDQETLTIYTCAGFWDKDRFIVRASRLDA